MKSRKQLKQEQTAQDLLDLISVLIEDKLQKLDATAVCQIVNKNSNGLYNIYIEPDHENLLHNIPTLVGGQNLKPGDYAYVFKINNRLNNAFILTKIGANSNDEVGSLVSKDEKFAWNNKQDALIAGDNITIVDNVISASAEGTTDSWRPIRVDGTEILGSGIQTGPLNLVAGNNITLDTSALSSGKSVTINADTSYPIEKVNSISDIPNNELGLYRFTEEVEGVAQSSHIYEVSKEDHEAGEREFDKTTTTNGTQLNSSTAFMNQFDSTLSNFISISSLTNVYCFYYNNDIVSRNGIRIGTKNTGSMTLTCTEDGTITFGKYFSYNGSTQVVTYDADSAVIVDGTKYEFEGSDEDTITVNITAGAHTITSNGQDISGGSAQGRIVLITFEFEGEPYSVYNKHALARVEEVQAVDTKLEQHKTESNVRFAEDERNISKNTNDITDINNRMGDIQFFQAATTLPYPSQQYLNKVYRLDNKFYQCVQKGEGALKEITFDTVTGTAEVTLSNVSGFITDLDRENFSEYFYLSYDASAEPPYNEWAKLFRNNGDIRLGSSSSTGNISFFLQDRYTQNLPCTKLKIGFKAYNANGSAVEIIVDDINDNEASFDYFIDNMESETLIDVPISSLSLFDNLSSFSIYSQDNHTADGETISNDKRVIITKLIAEFGTVEYEWKEINCNNIRNVSYDELKSLRDNRKLIPGQSYRITDYITATIQPDTRSAGHQFDIIVQALDVDILSENASVCLHAGDDYFGEEIVDLASARWLPGVTINDIEIKGTILYNEGVYENGVHNTAKLITEISTMENQDGILVPAMFNPNPETTSFSNSLVSVQYTLNDQEEFAYTDNPDGYKPEDIFVELAMENGIPVLYKNDLKEYSEEGVDHGDKFEYVGDMEVDGVLYNRWNKIDSDGESGYQVLTQVIVVNNQFTITQEQLTAAIEMEHEASDNDCWYVYSGIFKETSIVNNLVSVQYELRETEIAYSGESINHPEDVFVEIGYEEIEGVQTPIMYKNDLSNPEYVAEGTDYGDKFIYDGDMSVDGVTYNKWRKEEDGTAVDFAVLTQVIVVNNQFTITQEQLTNAIQEQVTVYDKWKEYYPGMGTYLEAYHLTNHLVSVQVKNHEKSKLSAWQIKYSLDNDTSRFLWALTGQAIINLNSFASNGRPLVRQPSFDGANPGSTEYQFAWGVKEDVDDADSIDFIYSKNATIVDGEIVYNAYSARLESAQVISGKGVIYYMKDEFSNECPYDFKNIQFKRYIIDTCQKSPGLEGKYLGVKNVQGYTIDEGDFIWNYTFTWINENNEVEDCSIVGQLLPTDENLYSGVFNNIIKECSAYDFFPEDQESFQFALNNIVIQAAYEHDSIFYGIYGNTFGNDCHSNTFGNNCYYNIFENDCDSNTFGNDCHSNTLGNECSRNIFGHHCSSNLFGSNCGSNTFGNNCYYNTFGGNCTSNTFGNNCGSNMFRKGCSYNTFGGNCTSNTFGNNCGSNTFGDHCYSNTFGDGCNSNIFGDSSSPVDYYQYNILDNGCQYLYIIGSGTVSSSNYLQNVHIHLGVKGTSVRRKIITVDRNLDYEYNIVKAGTTTKEV